VQPGLANFFNRQWQIAHQHNFVTALHVWACFAEFVYVQLNASSVTEPVAFVVTLDRFNFDAAFDASHALKGFFDNVSFQLALTGQLDVAKLCTAGTADAGLIPDVFDAVCRCSQNLLRLCATERSPAIFIDQSANLFAWQNVRDEDHSPLVSSHEDSAVCNFFDVEFEHAT
jgi:hypothetical protein